MEKYLRNQHIQLYQEDKLRADIFIDNGQVKIEKYTNTLFDQLFLSDNTTVKKIKEVFENRAFSKKRPGIKELLAKLNLQEYDAYDIIKKTHGISSSDNFWFKFNDENICYEDARKQICLL